MIKLSDKNVGRTVKVRGNEQIILSILADKTKFRIVQGAGIPVLDYTIEDIEETEGLVIDITA